MTPVGSGEDPVTLPVPQSPLVEVVEALPVATSLPGASPSESFDFSLEVSPAAFVVYPSTLGCSKLFYCSVRCKGKVSLEIIVSSSTSPLGRKNKPKNKVTKTSSNNNLTTPTSNQTESSGKSSKQASPHAKPSPKLGSGVWG